jgi:secreted trypsin-like serine protease
MKRRENSRTRRSLTALVLGLALVALLAPTAQASQRASASVIGGEDASITDFPSLAYLEAQTGPKSGFACTGTVIAPRVILTAGHCVLNIENGEVVPPSAFAVATGAADLRQIAPSNVFHVSRSLAYPMFDPSTLHNDAGLLVLSNPTPAPPIALAAGADNGLYVGGAPVRIAGWGLTDPNSSDTPPILQTTAAVVQPSDLCKKKVGGFYPFYSPGVQMCTTTPPKHTSGGCFGDSGGPVIGTRADGVPVELGIVSTGAPACNTRLPNIFTRVDKISTWAAEWIAAVEFGAPEPVVKVPKAELPRMTKSDAKDLVARALGIDFGKRFRKGKEQRIGCEQVEREKVKCGVSWFYGPNDYFGTVTVYYAINRNAVVWNARYTVQWVNDRCWFHSGHRSSCEIHSKHR